MFGSLGAPEIAIIGVVIILIFGVGKLSGLGRDLGSSIKEFRRAVREEDPQPPAQQPSQIAPPPPSPPQAQYTPPPPPAGPAPTGQGEQKHPNIF